MRRATARDTPAAAQRHDDGDEEEVLAHARRERDGIFRPEPHQDRRCAGDHACREQHGAEIKAGRFSCEVCGKDCGLHEQDVRHREERSNSGDDLLLVSVALLSACKIARSFQHKSRILSEHAAFLSRHRRGAFSLTLTAAGARRNPAPATLPGRSGGDVAMGARDAEGQLVVRAERLRERIVVDGRLDESFYPQFQPVGGFVQVEPTYGEPATEQTEMWVFFDDRAVYVGLRCFDSGIERWASLDLRRDSPGFGQAESVSVGLDPFHDRRNGFIFGVNAAGGISDSAITNERDSNRDWNTIWDARVGTVRRGVDGRDGDSVQVAPLRAGRAGVGHQRAPIGAVEERDVLSHARCRTRDRIRRSRACSGFPRRPR